MAKTARYALLMVMLSPFSLSGAYSAQSPLPEIAAIPPPPFEQQIEIDRSDRMTVPVRINGSKPYPFIIDTGAERTVIAQDLAKTLALVAGPSLALATITGASRVDSYVIDQLSMNKIRVDMITAPALERQHLGAYGLLGIDSLENHQVILDFSANKIDVLPAPKRKNITPIDADLIVVTAKRRAGRMILSNAKIGNINVDIILDTGAQSSMGNAALRRRLRNQDLRIAFVPNNMHSVTGALLQGEFTQIKQITVGGLDITNLPMTFADNYAFTALKLERRPAILLGMDALKLFDRVVIDFANRKVAFGIPRRANAYDSMRIASAQ